MSRIVFALALPVAVSVLGAILVGNVAAIGFIGDACRSHVGAHVRWPAVGEAALMQLLFGVGFALALALIGMVARRRFAALGRGYGKALETAAIMGILLFSLAQVIGQAACGLQPYRWIADALMIAATAAGAIAAMLLALTYARGLTGDRR